MTIFNYSVFSDDPRQVFLPNDGVAKVGLLNDDNAWKTAKWELSTFVCEGAYHQGMRRILETFIANLDRPTQPAVWVSGFYGSGKSHLVRVLELLWRDTQFPDGAASRAIAHLPTDIQELLAELSTLGRQRGGLWSASGTPGSARANSVRLAVLSVILAAAGLPTSYAQSRFVLWLKKRGFYDRVRRAVESAGESFERELLELSFSSPIATAVLNCDQELGTSVAAILDRLGVEFAPVQEISEDDLLLTVADVLALNSSRPGRHPLSLIVLDELQQFVADSPTRSAELDLTVQRICTRFTGSVLFVGTGQSALEGSAVLGKLKDRFTVRVELSDADVEQVVRKVILQKKPSSEPALSAALNGASGEISRHLSGTGIGASAADTPYLAPDYPLLPVRRRFWESVIRSFNVSGASQLRTQLRVTLEAVKGVADKPLGTVVSADVVFEQQRASLLQAGILLQDTDTTLKRLQSDRGDGPLESRICALIFLINRLNREPGSSIGIQPNADALADLLVDDLTVGSSELRRRIPEILGDLVASGVLMPFDHGFLLQTREGQEWEGIRRQRAERLRANTVKVSGERSARIKALVDGAIGRLPLVQGTSRTPRRSELIFSSQPPPPAIDRVPVWVRDGWGESEQSVHVEAEAAGFESPVVYLFVPRQGHDELDSRLIEMLAASETLDTRGEPSTPEGVEARQSMTARRDTARDRAEDIVRSMLNEAKLFLGGGAAVDGADLPAKAERACLSAASRLYSKFVDADAAGWNLALARARQGNRNALEAIGYTGEAADHPVVHDMLGYVGAGRKGSEVRRQFQAPPYGWPQDAIDAALVIGAVSGLLRVTRNGQPVTVTSIEQQAIGVLDFRRETAQVSAIQRIAIRGLLQQCGVQYSENEEANALGKLVDRLLDLAGKVSGAPPMPPAHNTELLDRLRSLSGNDLILEAATHRDDLLQDYTQWSALAVIVSARTAQWDRFEELLRHARALPSFESVRLERDTIVASRSLLAESDPVAPLIAQLSAALRQAVQEARQSHLDEYDRQVQALESDPAWQNLIPAQREAIRQERRLTTLQPLHVATNEDLLSELSSSPLSEWATRTDALPARITGALADAARLTEPAAVQLHLSTRTLRTEEDARAYLAEAEEQIMTQIHAGHPVVVGG